MKLPRENVYICAHNCINVTVDVDVGVTPFMMACVRKPTMARPIDNKFLGADGVCNGTARSTFYPKAPRPAYIPAPTHEWYKPIDLKGLSAGEAAHVARGGLLLRPRTSAEPVYHDEPPTPARTE